MHPVLFHIGHLILPTFGLIAALGLAGGLFLSLRTAAWCGLAPDELWDAGLFAIFAAFLLSRLLLVATNFASFRAAPILLLMQPSLTPGGLVLTAAATALYLRRHTLPLLPVLDAFAAPATLLWAALALGHLAEGSDPGLPAVHGLRTSAAGYREHPVALYAAVLASLLAAALYAATKRGHGQGRVAALALGGAGVLQFFLSFFRLPYLYLEPNPFTSLDPIQWVALGMVAAGGLLALRTGPGRAAAPQTSTVTVSPGA